MSTTLIMVCLIWQFTPDTGTTSCSVWCSPAVIPSPITVALNNLVNTSTGAKEYNVIWRRR